MCERVSKQGRRKLLQGRFYKQTTNYTGQLESAATCSHMRPGAQSCKPRLLAGACHTNSGYVGPT